MGGIILILLILCISTCIIEMIPFLFLKNCSKWIKASLICNLITNPIINLILALLTLLVTNNVVFILIAIVLEIAVIIFEAYIYHNIMDENMVKCIILSALCNILSFGIGLLLSNSLGMFDPPRNNFDRINAI